MHQSFLFLRKSAISSLVLFAISSTQTQAAEEPTGQFKYVIRATGQYEGIENPRRFNENDDTEELRQGRLGVQLNRATSRVTTDLNYQYDYLDYRKNLLFDRKFTTGTGRISYTPIRDTLTWDLAHTRQLQEVDAALPNTANNLQVVKTTQTGPNVQFNFGARNLLAASYVYSRSATTYNAVFKQDRGTFNTSFQRLITSNFRAGIVYNEFNTFSESSLLARYDRKIAALDAQYTSEKYQANVGVGYIESSSNLSSDYYNLDFTYVPITDTTLNLTYSDTVEDMFSNLMNIRGARPGFLPVNANPSTDINGVPSLSSNLAQQYKVDRGSIMLSHQLPQAFNYSLQYTTEDRVFANNLNDQSIDSFGIVIGVPVGQSINTSLSARDSDLYFRNNDRMQHRQQYTWNTNWTINRSFSLQLVLNHIKQKGAMLMDTYDGSSAMIGFTYQLAN